ncbi:MAG TPA: ATP-binding protein [Opitutaceae bacterium]|jgi:two-component system, sporulation sensor kinase E|nr:PAS domain-containing protein [Opitutaceae bacterium]OQB96700.1 MAG: Sporulation kinase E [Verrucomicrobia bacterium ADurb.Bin122]MBP8962128.1 PAS domain-containing protein [Opitutaceae bacterium]HNW41839.1 ATP-binding protein [Opitutaceae bacterium]HOD46232.1 ATP-binding protein [Opitutaceae bacterium]
MPPKRHPTLDRVLGRLDTLDSVNLANLVQRLARERGLFEDIFNALQEGVLVITADGEIEYANAAAHRLIGLGDGTLAGETLWRLVPGLRPSLGDVDDDAAMPVVAREFALTYPEPRVVRLYMVPFRSDGRVASRRFAVILNDITRDKATTEELLENERTSSILMLAGSVAHELGNPLNSLTIHLQLIERRLKKQKSTRETESLTDSISICREEVKRLDGIISNFLNAIRPQPPDLAEMRVVEVLSEVLHFQQRELTDRGITVEAETSDDLPPIMGDRNQLKQVFFNITKNAMEAMEPGGHLRIKTRADDDSVFLLFGDTGSGIKQEDLMKLFQPYHTTKPGGTGLGLMIAQRIMREHGGQIGVESKEGVGTLITLQFPRKDRRVRMLKG